MPLVVGITWIFAIITIALVGLSVIKPLRFLWPAVFTSWLFSFLTSWSIGQYTLSLTFILLAFAILHSGGWHRQIRLRIGALAAGLLVWAVLHQLVDDYWLFFPLSALLTQLLSA
jgi:hypothetical protein